MSRYKILLLFYNKADNKLTNNEASLLFVKKYFLLNF